MARHIDIKVEELPEHEQLQRILELPAVDLRVCPGVRSWAKGSRREKLTAKQLAVIAREEFLVWAVEAVGATRVDDTKN